MVTRSGFRKFSTRVIIPFFLFFGVALIASWFLSSQSTTTVIFVRHAEKVALPEDDPDLSAEGRERAERLADVLQTVDVIRGLDVIYATEYKRTQETAKPLADRLDIPVLVADAQDIAGLCDTILKEHRGKIVLVVAHSNTVPEYIAELGGHKKTPHIEDDEYSNIYIVSIPWFGKTKTLRIKYGDTL